VIESFVKLKLNRAFYPKGRYCAILEIRRKKLSALSSYRQKILGNLRKEYS